VPDETPMDPAGVSASISAPMAGVEAIPEWLSYQQAPSGATLAPLVAATDLQDRALLIEKVETFFFESGIWRVAQHAALLHLDRLQPAVGTADLVKALCFAEHACTLSNDDARPRLVMAQISWERRLPLAVLHDVERVLAQESQLRSDLGDRVANIILADASVLEGLARAYLRDVNRAHERLLAAERLGGLTVEACVQLLIAADPDFPDASMWAVRRIPAGVPVGGRVAGAQLRALRRVFLATLQSRGQG
jgi:hypothetical protein